MKEEEEDDFLSGNFIPAIETNMKTDFTSRGAVGEAMCVIQDVFTNCRGFNMKKGVPYQHKSVYQSGEVIKIQRNVREERNVRVREEREEREDMCNGCKRVSIPTSVPRLESFSNFDADIDCIICPDAPLKSEIIFSRAPFTSEIKFSSKTFENCAQNGSLLADCPRINVAQERLTAKLMGSCKSTYGGEADRQGCPASPPVVGEKNVSFNERRKLISNENLINQGYIRKPFESVLSDTPHAVSKGNHISFRPRQSVEKINLANCSLTRSPPFGKACGVSERISNVRKLENISSKGNVAISLIPLRKSKLVSSPLSGMTISALPYSSSLQCEEETYFELNVKTKRTKSCYDEVEAVGEEFKEVVGNDTHHHYGHRYNHRGNFCLSFLSFSLSLSLSSHL